MSISINFLVTKNTMVKKKGVPGMKFENFSYGIATRNQIENFDSPKNECCEPQRLSVVAGEMTKTTVQKTKFSQTSDTRFYF